MTTSMTEKPYSRYDIPPDLQAVLEHNDVMVSSLHQPSYLQGKWATQLFNSEETEFRSLGQGNTREEAVVLALRPVMKDDRAYWALRKKHSAIQGLLDKTGSLGYEFGELSETYRGAR